MALSGRPDIGFAYGRIAEIYGPEMSGKTTLALTIIREAQRAGLLTIFIDMEHALDFKYMRSLGIEKNNISIAQPNCGEDAIKLAEAGLMNGYKLVVIDSVAALTPKSELEGEPGDAHMGRLARLMGQAMRKLSVRSSEAEWYCYFSESITGKSVTIW